MEPVIHSGPNLIKRVPFRLLTTAVMLTAYLATLAVRPAAASDWQLARNDHGIKIYTRAVAGSAFLEFKGVAKVKTSFENLLTIMADTGSMCEWMHKCSEPSVLKQVSFSERYIYQVNEFPAPLLSRDVIMHSIATANKTGDMVTIRLQSVPRFCEQQESPACRNLADHRLRNRYVQITKAAGYFRLQKLGDELAEVMWQMHVEPGGDILGWIANLGIAEIPFQSLRGLQDYIARNASRRVRHDPRIDHQAVAAAQQQRSND